MGHTSVVPRAFSAHATAESDADGGPDLLGWKTTGEIVTSRGDGSNGFSNTSPEAIDAASTPSCEGIPPAEDWSHYPAFGSGLHLREAQDATGGRDAGSGDTLT